MQHLLNAYLNGNCDMSENWQLDRRKRTILKSICILFIVILLIYTTLVSVSKFVYLLLEILTVILLIIVIITLFLRGKNDENNTSEN